MTQNNDKNFQIFKYLSSINLTLDKKDLSKEIEKIKLCMKLYSVSSLARKQLKKNLASLTSIYSALERVDFEILQKDLDQITSELNALFEDFKLTTGVTYIPQPTKKKKEKKEVLTSLEDLSQINFNRNQMILNKTSKDEIKEEYNLLKKYLTNFENLLKNKPQNLFTKMSLIINVKTLDFIKLPRLGIIVSKTPYGILWSNQCVFIKRKDFNLTNKEIEDKAKDFFKEKVTLLYPKPMTNSNFPDYEFYWLLPIRVHVELSSFQVRGYALPFPYTKDKEKPYKQIIKELKEKRLNNLEEK